MSFAGLELETASFFPLEMNYNCAPGVKSPGIKYFPASRVLCTCQGTGPHLCVCMLSVKLIGVLAHRQRVFALLSQSNGDDT